MQVNLNAPLLDRKGEPIFENGTPVVLRDALYMAIDTPTVDDAQAMPINKLRLAQIGIRIAQAGDRVELTSADTTLVLERAARLTSALVFGQMISHLDPGQLGGAS